MDSNVRITINLIYPYNSVKITTNKAVLYSQIIRPTKVSNFTYVGGRTRMLERFHICWREIYQLNEAPTGKSRY